MPVRPGVAWNLCRVPHQLPDPIAPRPDAHFRTQVPALTLPKVDSRGGISRLS